MRHLRLLLPAALLAASILTFANANSHSSGAPPDPVITAVDQPSVDTMPSPSVLSPAPDNVQAVARVLAIETSDPAATVIGAFALMAPEQPRPLVLAGLSMSPLLNPYDDSVPIAAKRWAGRRAPRYNC
jgi:hypothetical protein